MNVFDDKISLSRYEYECLLQQMANLATAAKSTRGLISCSKLYLELVSTGVYNMNDELSLCYERDYKYSSSAQRLLQGVQDIRTEERKTRRGEKHVNNTN